ncbi:undecaprenyl-diphosphate phosphatase [Actinomadura rupiterrae]|uniref:undecaprenyl-diphosphate phosphatase n=1 Tax=Actinomadura rupiterrae TaxID=559627 RepID=UPI0020A535AF|nr:undecaprenyl-diphosphate phosphatase [Actinomadura rupiterrae]MCP2336699.1 undecaprenyl-diphosphatase [Actinomadura rupiterrae]
MSLTYPEAIVVGLFQGVTELFPVSSLGHSVLIPALVGGRWARDLDVSASQSPYLAFLVGLHVATALALVVFFWRDWIRITVGLLTSLRDRRIATSDQRLAWLLIVATVPVGAAGLALDHVFRTVLGKPIPAALFLAANGLLLFVGERLRRKAAPPAPAAPVPARQGAPAWDASSRATRADLPIVEDADVASDRRLARLGWWEALLIGAAEILALLPGISRSGATMVAGLTRGLTHEDAARFSFLLATPVILAAGVLKLPELTGAEGKGIHGQILAGSVAAAVAAYLAVRFLVKYFETRTLTPFAIYCGAAGLLSAAYLAAT